MVELTKRGQAWLVGDVPITGDVPVWMRALGLPWRRVTLYILDGEPFVRDYSMTRREDAPPEPYPPPTDAEWSWDPSLEDEYYDGPGVP